MGMRLGFALALAIVGAACDRPAIAAEPVPGDTRQSPDMVVTIDDQENVYLHNTWIGYSALSAQLNSRRLRPVEGRIFIRADRNVRFEAVGRAMEAFRAAGFATVRLGNPPLSGQRLVPIQMLPGGAVTVRPFSEQDGNRRNAVPRIAVDFDGTVILIFGSRPSSSIPRDIVQLARRQAHGSDIIIVPNKLSRYSVVMAVIREALAEGFVNVMIPTDEYSQ